ncbi:hypothetical protein [Paeniglutamicibacter terrestris]|uniref:Uncharacterized protein n=1 Tax=Paeniglutamicibacter terrestris TaxID=2723403 RepID=A0ABX1G7I4_9MICC|nr:hypothetical protein [Paeniglutamicibacter terrestris]NKG22228.1 hypothetical protein [Paeniglutamicibacter terrestris]
MILSETLNCAGSIADAQTVFQLSCEMPVQSEFWPAFWQAIAALATLVAVAVALFQSKSAGDAAEQANKTAAKANELLDQRHQDDRYRQASRVIAWTEIDAGTQNPRVYIENASDDAIYKITVTNDGLPDGKWELPIMRPRTMLDTSLAADSRMYKPSEIIPVHLSFEDSLGRTYERDPDKGGFLSDIGPCWT